MQKDIGVAVRIYEVCCQLVFRAEDGSVPLQIDYLISYYIIILL